ncbi:MAG: protease inhibitor I42 family protein [Anaerolineaceae bacterium]|nr:protease inhibitor I42 family protein [Anaerolineaceae bacterium]
MKINFSIILFLIATLTLLAGCGSGPRTVNLDERSNGQTIQMKTGEILQVHLPSDPINGYSWQEKTLDPNLLEASKDVQYIPVGKDPVAGGTEVLTFQTLKAGTTVLELVYKRASGEGVSLPKYFQVTIEIK